LGPGNLYRLPTAPTPFSADILDIVSFYKFQIVIVSIVMQLYIEQAVYEIFYKVEVQSV